MKKRILCFGDSNTWGADPKTGDRYADDVRWTGVLQRELGNGYQVIEEGYNGRTSIFDDVLEGRLGGIKYFGPCCDTQSPLDVIVLMLGTNDLKLRFGLTPKTIAFGFNRYVDTLNITPMAGKKPKVLLVSPILIDPSYKNHPLFYDMFGEDATEKSMALAEAYQEFADANGWEFLNAAAFAKASTADGVHMEPADHSALGIAVARKVKSILE